MNNIFKIILFPLLVVGFVIVLPFIWLFIALGIVYGFDFKIDLVPRKK